MPELPEIVVIAEQMHQTLRGKQVQSILLKQPKCGNRSVKDYQKAIPGRSIEKVTPLGKWLEMQLDQSVRFLISLGMGGEVCYFEEDQSVPQKSRLVVKFVDGTGFYVTLWWFGYFHLVLRGETHPMTDKLGPDPLDMSENAFLSLLEKKRGSIKSFLLNQKRIRGIGNFYIQEILFQSKLHPLREVHTIAENERRCLYHAIQNVLKQSISLGSSSYEVDFFGAKGKYNLDCMAIGYRENKTCPDCRTTVQKIKTGSNMQYICPQCQSL